VFEVKSYQKNVLKTNIVQTLFLSLFLFHSLIFVPISELQQIKFTSLRSMNENCDIQGKSKSEAFHNFLVHIENQWPIENILKNT
jgi:hypothetical protein